MQKMIGKWMSHIDFFIIINGAAENDGEMPPVEYISAR